MKTLIHIRDSQKTMLEVVRRLIPLMLILLYTLIGCSMGNKTEKNTSAFKIDQFFDEIEAIKAGQQHLNISKYLFKKVAWEGYVLSISSEPSVKSKKYLLVITVQPNITNRFVDCWVHKDNYGQLKGLVSGQKVMVEGVLHIRGYTSNKSAPVLLDGGRKGMPSLTSCIVTKLRGH